MLLAVHIAFEFQCEHGLAFQQSIGSLSIAQVAYDLHVSVLLD